MTKKKPDFLRDLDTAIMDELTGGGIQTDEAAAAGEAGNDRTALTLSKAVKAGCKVIALERTDTVAGMTTDDIAALKGVLKQYE